MKKLLIIAAIVAAWYYLWYKPTHTTDPGAGKPDYFKNETTEPTTEAAAKAKMIKLYGNNWEKVLSGKAPHPTTGLYFINGQWKKML